MEMIQHIDRLMEQRPASREILSAYRDLLVAMGEARPRTTPVCIDEDMRERKTREGLPLFSKKDMPLDFREAARLLERMLEHSKGRDRPDHKGMERASTEIRRDLQWARCLFTSLLSERHEDLSVMALGVGLAPETLRFLGMTALKPCLAAVRKAHSEKLHPEDWEYGYCPCCGSGPDMASFDKAGKRHLFCGTCGEEWPYPRLACPFCGNTDQATLGYFHSEEEEGFRVDFCRACSKYIKTVDRRVFERIVPMELEFLATVHLDLLAAQHGFQ